MENEETIQRRWRRPVLRLNSIHLNLSPLPTIIALEWSTTILKARHCVLRSRFVDVLFLSRRSSCMSGRREALAALLLSV